jgi:hypothetical protein
VFFFFSPAQNLHKQQGDGVCAGQSGAKHFSEVFPIASYDNLGLEPVIKRTRSVLVSDGGAPFAPQPRPWAFWPLQVVRVLLCEDNQVRALRKRDLVARYKLYTSLENAGFDPWSTPETAAMARKGAYWGITTDVANYPAKPGLPCPSEATERLAQVSTRHEGRDAGAADQLGLRGHRLCGPLACRSPHSGGDQVALPARAELNAARAATHADRFRHGWSHRRDPPLAAGHVPCRRHRAGDFAGLQGTMKGHTPRSR